MKNAKEILDSMSMDERTAFIRDYGTQAWEALLRDAATDDGDDGGQRGQQTGTPRRSEMSTKEKVAYINEHGEEAFRALPLE